MVTDQQLIIHVLHHLPNEYENLVDDLERALNDQVNPLNVEILKDRLHSKWEKILRLNG